MAANWESLEAEHDPRIAAATRARFLGAWQEHRRIYGYTLLAELPYALRAIMIEHPDLGGLDYDLIVVDEYQDLNACDLEVLRLIAARGVAIIAAGDDDQSVYSFRRAAPEGIRRFPTDYPGSADYTLSVTQRCGRRIVEWAEYVIRGDPDRGPERPPLTSADGSPDGETALLAFAGEQSEAAGVATIVEHLITREGIAPSEVLILHRADYLDQFSEPIREELGRRAIPYANPEVINQVLAEPQNRRLFEVLRILVRPEDSLAWGSLLQLTPGIGKTFIDYVENRARAQDDQFGRTLLEAYHENFAGAPRAPAAQARALLAEVEDWCHAHPVPEQEPEGGWGPWILGTAGGAVAPEPTEALQTLLGLRLGEPQQDLARYLGQLGPAAKDWALAEAAGVRLMTMQGSKGLTVRAVVVAAAEEGIIPRLGNRGEERRLLYVAMTRAREFLFCTWARRRRGPTARAGEAAVAVRRHSSSFFDGGPMQTEDGHTYLRHRWGAGV
jgi:DNA helicase-2/ATP-dependent DNA helicase PcrA